MKILVAEDHSDTALVYKYSLEDKGHKVTITNDGVECLKGSFGKIKSEQLKNESGRTMTLQGSGFASTFQMEGETFTLAPSDSQWSDPDLPHQFSTRSGAVAKFSWRGS